jgi:hypothetical protein
VLSPRAGLPGGPPRLRPAALALLAGAAVSLHLAACATLTGLLKPSPGSAERLASRGQFREALNEYKSLHARFPEDGKITASYRETVGSIMAGAETEYLRGNVAAAGRGYRILCDSYPDFSAFAASLSFDRAALRGKMDQCVNQLTNEGLQQYRRGEIKQAIALWRGILTFDPDNIEIRKAIDNAAAQDRTLRDSK